jgi:transposase-like protein
VRALVGGVSLALSACRSTAEERGVSVDHATIHRWVVRYSPPLEEAFHHRQRPVECSGSAIPVMLASQCRSIPY